MKKSIASLVLALVITFSIFAIPCSAMSGNFNVVSSDKTDIGVPGQAFAVGQTLTYGVGNRTSGTIRVILLYNASGALYDGTTEMSYFYSYGNTSESRTRTINGTNYQPGYYWVKVEYVDTAVSGTMFLNQD
ncbi:hypothetical protein LY28_00002 [Ruminiclostridium sufflavum DSM 19573]|uniref:Uncharacterized protein n=1 Tax=Ruminiclostridium sufflavum DSM 19573 TaxID=1121337 RepID=A0A318YBQ0_9FIRM|nr:hypothetical protein [Ruminiclostridium sufflavum]PYG90122.1 hypothetical protein LY28_00002 [Ruminiclostridium sufflavum DSM 19573]